MREGLPSRFSSLFLTPFFSCIIPPKKNLVHNEKNIAFCTIILINEIKQETGRPMTNQKQLHFYTEAPDVLLKDTENREVKLSQLWAEGPLLLAFTRHFGCTQCKEMLSELVAGREQIKEAGLSIVVITQGTPESTALFAEEHAPGLYCLADPDRKAYQAYGLERGTLFQTFLNLKVLAAVKRSQRKGYKVEAPPEGQDAMLMSGTFIISREGRVLLPFYYDDIADHPALELFLNGVLATDWKKPFDGPLGRGINKS